MKGTSADGETTREGSALFEESIVDAVGQDDPDQRVVHARDAAVVDGPFTHIGKGHGLSQDCR